MKIVNILKKLGAVLGIIIALLAIIWFGSYKIRVNYSKSYYQSGLQQLASNPDLAMLDFSKAVFLNSGSYKSWYQKGLMHRSYGEYQEASDAFANAFKHHKTNSYLLSWAESAIKSSDIDSLNTTIQEEPNSDDKIIISFILEKKFGVKNENDPYDLSNQNQKQYFLALNAIYQQKYTEFGKILPKVQASQTKNTLPRYVNWHLDPTAEDLTILQNLNQKISGTEIKESKELFTYQALNELGFSSLTLEPLKKLSKKYPKYLDAWLVLGEANYLEEKNQDALNALKSAENLDPTNVQTLGLLAQTYTALGQADMASDYQAQIDKSNH